MKVVQPVKLERKQNALQCQIAPLKAQYVISVIRDLSIKTMAKRGSLITQ